MNWTRAAIGLGLLLLGSHAALLFGYAAPMWDAVDFFAPYFMLIGDFARSGRLLLWNPFTFAGLPDYLEPQLGALSPLVVLFGLTFGATPLSFALYWFTIWLSAGLGGLCLARYLGAPVWGGIACAVAFMFSGIATNNATHTAMLYTLSFLPWLLWRVDVAVLRRQVRPAVEAGVLSGLSGLGGYPALVFLNGCFVLLWTFGRVLLPEESPGRSVMRRLGRASVAGIIVILVGGVVLSPTYVPFFIEAADVSDRAGPMAWDDAVENQALHPAAVTTLSSPALLFADVFRYTDITLRNLYVGCAVLAFATFGLLRRPAVAFRWWLLLIGLLFLVSAMGRALPVRGWLYEWVLPTRYFRAAALFGCYSAFALVLLAICGVSDLATSLQGGDSREWRRFGFTVAGVAGVVLAVYLGATDVVRRTTPPPHVFSHWHTFGSWFLLCLIAWRGSVRAGRSRRFAPLALVALATGDALSTAWITRPIMYNPDPAAWHRLELAHRPQIDLTSTGLIRRVENGGNLAFTLKTPALRGYSGLAGRLNRLYAVDGVLAAAATGTDRLWFSRSIGIVDRSEHCFEVFRARSAVLGETPLVVHPERSTPNESTDAACDVVMPTLQPAMRVKSYEVVAYDPDRLTLRVDVPEAGWLLVTDTWSSRWRATVNGRPSALRRGNFIFRAVQISRGTSTIEFRYEAVGFPWLLILSWGLVLTVGAWSFLARRSGHAFS